MAVFVLSSTLASIGETVYFVEKLGNNPYHYCHEGKKDLFIWAREHIHNKTYSASRQIDCHDENERLYNLALLKAIVVTELIFKKYRLKCLDIF